MYKLLFDNCMWINEHDDDATLHRLLCQIECSTHDHSPLICSLNNLLNVRLFDARLDTANRSCISIRVTKAFARAGGMADLVKKFLSVWSPCKTWSPVFWESMGLRPVMGHSWPIETPIHTCSHAEFGYSRSNRTSVRTDRDPPGKLDPRDLPLMQGHLRSLEPTRIDRLPITSYYCSIVTIGL